MAGKTLVQVLLLAVFICSSTTIFTSATNERKNGICREKERLALLKFKQGLNFSSEILSTWVGDDCCKWAGVGCNNKTGHVVNLNLHNLQNLTDVPWDCVSFYGEINPSLLELVHLHHLDLSFGCYGSKPIPKFFGSFKKLEYLNLSYTDFVGIVPHQLGNLSNLHVLDLSQNPNTSKLPLQVDNFHWLSHLSSLQYLDLSLVNISMATDWLQSLNFLPSLSVLRLHRCDIRELPPLSYTNFTSLTLLDLSGNWITSEFPDWLPDVGNLVHLAMGFNNLHGSIPSVLGCLCHLETLDLSYNNMDGEISGFIQSLSRCGSENLVKNGRHSSIRELHLHNNNFSGALPEGLGQLSNLVHLSMQDNSLHGVLSEAHFANLRNLESLRMCSNFFVFNFSSDWVPPFQLKKIGLRSCQLGPRFPQWLRFQKGYEIMDISNAQVSDEIPNWIWNLSSEVSYLNLSQNEMRGILPTSMRFPGFAFVDLGSNKFMGQLPLNISGAYLLDLSNNSFSGKISSNYSGISVIDISNNHLTGSIPSSICDAESVDSINLSKNQFSGEIPVCFGNITSLGVLDLSHNDLNGVIPSMSGCRNLEWLKLSDNNLSGEIHSLFGSLNNLVVVDLSENRLSGTIPIWMEESISRLKILKLRSNMFVGNIPRQLSSVHHSLQILDLAHNRLSGTIPSSFGGFDAMKVTHDKSEIIGYGGIILPDFYGETETEMFEQKMVLVMKGRGLEYTTILSLVTIIDLSCNNLFGEIPEELVHLRGLHSLNLSGNHLNGKIPKEIGTLKQLESLDLSRNFLSGEIPSSISSLTFLSSLNLSYNNLSGQIPLGNQLQALPDPSIYIGNHDLCGRPLTKICNGEQVSQTSKTLDGEDEEDKTEQLWFYGSMALGFVMGFWSFCGILLFNNSWRIGYYRFITNIIDHLNGLFVYMIVKMVKK